MIEIYLVRHAESEGNLRPDLVSGQSNHYPLTELGQRQAQWLGQRLREWSVSFDVIATSSARRTQETLLEVCIALGIAWERVQVSDELLELHQGEWVGLPRKEVYTPEVLAHIAEDNWNFKAPGGESQREVEERMWGWLDREVLQKLGDQGKALIVTHGVAIKCLLRRILDSTASMTHKIRIDNTSITKISWDAQKGWFLECVNDTAHFL